MAYMWNYGDNEERSSLRPPATPGPLRAAQTIQNFGAAADGTVPPAPMLTKDLRQMAEGMNRGGTSPALAGPPGVQSNVGNNSQIELPLNDPVSRLNTPPIRIPTQGTGNGVLGAIGDFTRNNLQNIDTQYNVPLPQRVDRMNQEGMQGVKDSFTNLGIARDKANTATMGNIGQSLRQFNDFRNTVNQENMGALKQNPVVNAVINAEGKGFSPNETDFDEVNPRLPQFAKNMWEGSELQRQTQQAGQNIGRMFGVKPAQAATTPGTPEQAQQSQPKMAQMYTPDNQGSKPTGIMVPETSPEQAAAANAIQARQHGYGNPRSIGENVANRLQNTSAIERSFQEGAGLPRQQGRVVPIEANGMKGQVYQPTQQELAAGTQDAYNRRVQFYQRLGATPEEAQSIVEKGVVPVRQAPTLANAPGNNGQSQQMQVINGDRASNVRFGGEGGYNALDMVPPGTPLSQEDIAAFALKRGLQDPQLRNNLDVEALRGNNLMNVENLRGGYNLASTDRQSQRAMDIANLNAGLKRDEMRQPHYGAVRVPGAMGEPDTLQRYLQSGEDPGYAAQERQAQLSQTAQTILTAKPEEMARHLDSYMNDDDALKNIFRSLYIRDKARAEQMSKLVGQYRNSGRQY